jgi:hypothetical protein
MTRAAGRSHDELHSTQVAVDPGKERVIKTDGIGANGGQMADRCARLLSA